MDPSHHQIVVGHSSFTAVLLLAVGATGLDRRVNRLLLSAACKSAAVSSSRKAQGNQELTSKFVAGHFSPNHHRRGPHHHHSLWKSLSHLQDTKLRGGLKLPVLRQHILNPPVHCQRTSGARTLSHGCRVEKGDTRIETPRPLLPLRPQSPHSG